MKVFEFDKIPIVEIVNEILLDGVKKGASDIHFDPSKESITIRMRVDGVLHDYAVVPLAFKRNIVSRVKMIASMNIMETRLPQDGAIKSKIGDKMLDLRVSSLPTNCGEKIVMRILDYSKSLQGLETLGFSEENLNKIFKMVAVPNGIVLVTGATGSGKSTTVYSILQRLNTREVNIITVEDPVEMDVEGLNQVQAQQEIGLDFASVLRSILRQDPDIIMIGEIRDTETAQIAVRASITGHKVLSTIHTNSALNTIERLIDMGVERYLIGTSLSGIISQKLARKLCPNCKVERETTDYEKHLIHEVLHLDVDKVFDANPDGCDKCTRGYKNRVAIAEVLFIDDVVRTGITNDNSKEEMRRLVYGGGKTYTLLQDGLDKIVKGETSFDEILKLADLENDLAIAQELDELGESAPVKETTPAAPVAAPAKPEETKPTEVKPEEAKPEEVKVEATPQVENKPAEGTTPEATPQVTPQAAPQAAPVAEPTPTPAPAPAPAPTPIPETPAAPAAPTEQPVQSGEPTVNSSSDFDDLLFVDLSDNNVTGEEIKSAQKEEPVVETIELSAVIPPNNTAAAVNLNTGETPNTIKMFE